MTKMNLRALLIAAILVSAPVFAQDSTQLGASAAAQPTSYASDAALPAGRRELPLQPGNGEMIPSREQY